MKKYYLQKRKHLLLYWFSNLKINSILTSLIIFTFPEETEEKNKLKWKTFIEIFSHRRMRQTETIRDTAKILLRMYALLCMGIHTYTNEYILDCCHCSVIHAHKYVFTHVYTRTNMHICECNNIHIHTHMKLQ